ncbi:MAG: DegT/DnrJ/EryC1/StrS aminotransferase family protein [Magnetococcales bacterium]|nr:DegT/DnrJ/EryC1/StrS aminotransferase family protein [Magnetococcales bacterium]
MNDRLFLGPLRPEDLPFITSVPVAEVPGCCFVASGHHALRLLARSLRLAPGSRVALPAMICPTVPAALRAEGLLPAFVDLTPDGYVMDFDRERFYQAGYDLIVLPHLYGLPHPRTAEIVDFARNSGIPLIHDAAQSLGLEWEGQPIIRLDQGGFYSFGAGKAGTAATGALACGIDPGLMERLGLDDWRLWDPASRDFMRRRMGLPGRDWLAWLRSDSFRASRIQVWAACRVLERLPVIEEGRRRNWRRLRDLLGHELYGDPPERISCYKFVMHARQPLRLPPEWSAVPVRSVTRHPASPGLPVYETFPGALYEISTERSLEEYAGMDPS